MAIGIRAGWWSRPSRTPRWRRATRTRKRATAASRASSTGCGKRDEEIVMSLLVKARRGRTIVEVTPQSARWRYVGFAAYRLEAGEVLELAPVGREQCVVV